MDSQGFFSCAYKKYMDDFKEKQLHSSVDQKYLSPPVIPPASALYIPTSKLNKHVH